MILDLIREELWRLNHNNFIAVTDSYLIQCSTTVIKQVQKEMMKMIEGSGMIITGEKAEEVPGPHHFINFSMPGVGTLRFEVCLETGYKIEKL